MRESTLNSECWDFFWLSLSSFLLSLTFSSMERLNLRHLLLHHLPLFVPPISHHLVNDRYSENHNASATTSATASATASDKAPRNPGQICPRSLTVHPFSPYSRTPLETVSPHGSTYRYSPTSFPIAASLNFSKATANSVSLYSFIFI